jgi:pimeloyl-ACP methyl ester carboxylesterase
MKLRRKRFELMVFEPNRHRLLVGEDIGDENSPHLFLCLPGLLETRASFESFVTHVAPHARVMTLDWCGRGDSDRLHSSHDYRMSVYLSDLSLFYSHATGAISNLMESTGRMLVSPLGKVWPAPTPQIHLVGTSMGGLLGVALASHRPLHLGKVVLNDVGPVLPWSGVFSLMTGIAAAKTTGLDKNAGMGLAERLNVDPNLLRAVRQPGHLDLPHETRLAGVDFSHTFASVAVPILLLRGMKSKIINDTVVKGLIHLHPATVVHECEACGHPVEYSEDVCRKILEFAQQETQ